MGNKVNFAAIGTGFFALIALLITLLMWLHKKNYDTSSALYAVHFKQSVMGLRKTDPVVYNGIIAGRVVEIAPHPRDIQTVVVRLRVDPRFVIKEDATASLEARSITGGAVIQIYGGSNEAKVLHATKDIPVITTTPSRFDKVFDTVPEFMSRASDILADIHGMFAPEQKAEIAAMIKNIHLVVQNFAGSDMKEILNLTRHNLVSLNRFLNEGTDALRTMKRFFESVERSPARFFHNDPAKGVRLP